MPRNNIEFWFSAGSTYTFLTASRLHEVAAATGIRFNWRPFNLRAILRDTNFRPFEGKPARTASTLA